METFDDPHRQAEGRHLSRLVSLARLDLLYGFMYLRISYLTYKLYYKLSIHLKSPNGAEPFGPLYMYASYLTNAPSNFLASSPAAKRISLTEWYSKPENCCRCNAANSWSCE